MSGAGPGRESGCGSCWPQEAEAAWQASRACPPVALLVDESPFI